jgi:NADPH:quinone reductase-like Zn-dependent oxidoreductase
MKTHQQILITVICMTALLVEGAALAQETGPGSPTPATTATAERQEMGPESPTPATATEPLVPAATKSAAPASITGTLMKAIVYHHFGPPDVLRLEEVPKPVPDDNQVLVKVRAAAINPLDWHFMEGSPYIARLLGFGLLRPKETRLGVDYSGTVEAVGKNVTRFKPGDDVFGGRDGALAEYVCALADKGMTLKPANVTFEQAASVPIAGVTALQGLRDKGHVKPGDKVLINGASGGVGTFAVQIAKSFGADVTGVCSTRHLDLVRRIGADHVIDYTKEDFTKSGQRYDVIIDNVGNHSLLEFRRVLKPNGRYVLIGGGGVNDGRWVGPLANPIRMLVLAPFVNQQMGAMMAVIDKRDLGVLADLMQSGKVKPVIDRTYPLNQTADAMRYLEKGHASGKVIITMEEAAETLPATANSAGVPANATSAGFIAFVLIVVAVGVTIAPIILALVLNRRFRARNPEKRSYRWGYYFSIMSFIGGIVLGDMLGFGIGAVIVCGAIYGLLAWFFAQRHHWAWITLTVLSFNPIAWVVNSIYLWKRWHEGTRQPA